MRLLVILGFLVLLCAPGSLALIDREMVTRAEPGSVVSVVIDVGVPEGSSVVVGERLPRGVEILNWSVSGDNISFSASGRDLIWSFTASDAASVSYFALLPEEEGTMEFSTVYAAEPDLFGMRSDSIIIGVPLETPSNDSSNLFSRVLSTRSAPQGLVFFYAPLLLFCLFFAFLYVIWRFTHTHHPLDYWLFQNFFSKKGSVQLFPVSEVELVEYVASSKKRP